MFSKGVSLETRLFNMKRHALATGRTFMGKLDHIYHSGKHIANAVDRGYQMFKRIHSAVQPALMDAAPSVAKATKQVMGSYEATRKAVMGADALGQKVAGVVRREMA